MYLLLPSTDPPSFQLPKYRIISLKREERRGEEQGGDLGREKEEEEKVVGGGTEGNKVPENFMACLQRCKMPLESLNFSFLCTWCTVHVDAKVQVIFLQTAVLACFLTRFDA